MGRPRRRPAVPPQYEPTRIPGLFIGTEGPQRGLYFVMRAGKMARLRAALNSPEMHLEIAGADMEAIVFDGVAPDMRDALYDAHRRAKARARLKGIACDVTVHDVLDIYLQQNCVCALTGMAIALPSERNGGERRGPWAPSLDRIDSSGGYTRRNVQVTTVMANLAKAEFAMEDFLRMCALTAVNRRLLTSKY